MKDLLPEQAYRFLQDNPKSLFLDVRSEAGHLFVGRPAGAILIEWIDSTTWEINSDFVTHVKRAAGNTGRPLVLICRSGRRSAEAGRVLENEGFSEVYNVLHGFEGELDDRHHRGQINGWRHDDLPWIQT